MPVSPPANLKSLSTRLNSTMPMPSVAMARLMPRVRSAGNATSTPTSAAAAIAPTNAGRKLQPARETKVAAAKAPDPASTYWASDSCPAYPVTTVTDRVRIANAIVTVRACAHTGGTTNAIRTANTPTTTTVGTTRMRPSPTLGRRSSTWLRSGSELPRRTR
jgi:hypothetical protein